MLKFFALLGAVAALAGPTGAQAAAASQRWSRIASTS